MEKKMKEPIIIWTILTLTNIFLLLLSLKTNA